MSYEAMDALPWVPASLAARLTVGARVRVRLSGECEMHNSRASVTALVNGKTGAITWAWQGRAPGHDYAVVFDVPEMGPDGDITAGLLMVSGVFTASELDPLPEPDPPGGAP